MIATKSCTNPKGISTVRYSKKLRHKRALVKVWQAFTCASKEAQVHIIREWRKSELALLIPRDRFLELITKEK